METPLNTWSEPCRSFIENLTEPSMGTQLGPLWEPDLNPLRPPGEQSAWWEPSGGLTYQAISQQLYVFSVKFQYLGKLQRSRALQIAVCACQMRNKTKRVKLF